MVTIFLVVERRHIGEQNIKVQEELLLVMVQSLRPMVLHLIKEL
jgi:hypothetical protein